MPAHSTAFRDATKKPELLNRREDGTFAGFRFLGGVCLVRAKPEDYSDAEVRFIVMVALGKPNREIMERIRSADGAPDNYPTAERDFRAGVRDSLGVTERAALLPAALRCGVMAIPEDGYAPAERFPVTPKELWQIGGTARGETLASMARDRGLPRSTLDGRYQKIADRVLFRGMELFSTAAIMTHQLLPADCEPRMAAIQP